MLTKAELNVVQTMIDSGHVTERALADHLSYSLSTVHTHFRNMFLRTDTNNKVALVLHLLRKGLVTL